MKRIHLSVNKIVAIAFVGFALAFYSYYLVLMRNEGLELREEKEYLYRGYSSNREYVLIGICVGIFVLLILFNMFVKNKWVYRVVDVIAIVVLCNPITLFFGLLATSETEFYYTIENESDFNTCAEDMRIDFENFPRYNEFDDQDVQFVGKAESGFFFYQSITAIVKYDSLESCEADYGAYVDSHRFLTEPVADDHDEEYILLAAPEFNYEGIYFRVVTEGEEDHFPKRIYMIGIDRVNSTLYYLYLDDHDLDYMAESGEPDLEGEMRDMVEDHSPKYSGALAPPQTALSWVTRKR